MGGAHATDPQASRFFLISLGPQLPFEYQKCAALPNSFTTRGPRFLSQALTAGSDRQKSQRRCLTDSGPGSARGVVNVNYLLDSFFFRAGHLAMGQTS